MEPPLRHLPTLRQLLMLLAFACVLPMAALSLAMVVYQYQHERRHTEATAIGTARALMAAVDDRLDSVERSLQALANSPALDDADYAALREEALALQRTERVISVALVDAGGQQLMNTRAPLGAALPGQSPPQVLEPLRRQVPAVLDLYRSPVTGDYTLGVGVPLGSDRTLNATISPLWLREVLSRQKLPPHWIAAVLDRSGTIVARTHEHERYVGTRARAALVARIDEVAEDAVPSTTVDGVPVITAFSRASGSGYAVAIGMPRAELVAPIIESTAVLVAGTVGVLLLTLWMAWRLARRLSASVEALGGALRATGHHAHLALPAPAFQEAHQLGQTLLHAQAAVDDADEALARSEARMRSILDATTDAIIAADEAGRVVHFNRAAERLLRFSRDEAVGRDLDTLVPPALRALHRRLAERAPSGATRIAADALVDGVCRDGTPYRAEATITLAEGEQERLYTVLLRPVPDTRGRDRPGA